MDRDEAPASCSKVSSSAAATDSWTPDDDDDAAVVFKLWCSMRRWAWQKIALLINCINRFAITTMVRRRRLLCSSEICFKWSRIYDQPSFYFDFHLNKHLYNSILISIYITVF